MLAFYRPSSLCPESLGYFLTPSFLMPPALLRWLRHSCAIGVLSGSLFSAQCWGIGIEIGIFTTSFLLGSMSCTSHSPLMRSSFFILYVSHMMPYPPFPCVWIPSRRLIPHRLPCHAHLCLMYDVSPACMPWIIVHFEGKMGWHGNVGAAHASWRMVGLDERIMYVHWLAQLGR